MLRCVVCRCDGTEGVVTVVLRYLTVVLLLAFIFLRITLHELNRMKSRPSFSSPPHPHPATTSTFNFSSIYLNPSSINTNELLLPLLTLRDMILRSNAQCSTNPSSHDVPQSKASPPKPQRHPISASPSQHQASLLQPVVSEKPRSAECAETGSRTVRHAALRWRLGEDRRVGWPQG